MGMDLMNEHGDYFRHPRMAWRNILALAKLYGWEPKGTKKPDYPGLWLGGYDTNDGQLVTREDAAALADALEKSLDDIPDVLNIPKFVELDIESYDLGEAYRDVIAELGEDADNVTIRGHDPNLTPFEFFGGDYKRIVIEFIEFCRHGGFTIW